MTELIDTNIVYSKYPHQALSNTPKIHASSQQSKKPESHPQKFHQQNCSPLIIKENHSPYSLLLAINPNHFFTSIKIQLLKKNGNLLKIQQQQSKTYLIRKFLEFSNDYQPRIDPITGDVYFSLDYFQLQYHRHNFTEHNLMQVYRSLNLQKLNQSIQKFLSFYYKCQQNNWTETEHQFRNQYQKLSKAVCLMNDSNLVDNLLAVSQKKNQTKTQSLQKIQKHNFLQELHQYSSKGWCPQPQLLDMRLLEKQLEGINFEAKNLGTLTKRKQGKSNYQTLLINHNTEKVMKEMIYRMVETKTHRTSMKVVESDLGKVTLNFEKEQDSIYRMKMKFLNSLPRNTEYHFLDKYFKNSENVPVLISLSLKQESLERYLQNNTKCLSMQTKMRILLQICSAVHTLWQQRNIILYVNSLKNMHITKNLTIKLRNLTNFYKVEPHVMLEDKALVNVKLLDNWLNLSQIYFNLFFNYNLNYIRPAYFIMVGSRSTEHLKAKIMSKRALGAKLSPEGFSDPTKQILVGLNYIFLSFIDMANKVIIEPQMKKGSQREMFMRSQSKQKVHENESTTRLLSYKLTCCWLFKNFELITKQGI